MLFESAEEAEKFLKERRLLFKISKWAEMKNEEWKPDWSDQDCSKYAIYYNGAIDLLKVEDWAIINHISIFPVFKSRKIAYECIDLFGDEIKEVLIRNAQI